MGLWLAMVGAVVAGSLLAPPPLALEAPSGSDKLVHVLAYAVLALGAVQLFARVRPLALAGAALMLLGYALEVLQGELTLTRQFDPGDALANGLGVLLGLALRETSFAGLARRLDARWFGPR
jgi:hypothetical protein